MVDRTDFSDQFRKKIIRHKRIGFDLNVMWQSASLVINPTTVIFFSETIAASDLKVSTSRHLMEYVKICEY